MLEEFILICLYNQYTNILNMIYRKIFKTH